MRPTNTWPEGRHFAFTVFDDTDAATVENVAPVYEFLRDCGIRTTKSVWPLAGKEAPSIIGGATCADTNYLQWVKQLQAAGFEISFHNATFHSSKRSQTIEGLDTFAHLFGHDPRAMANHTFCQDGIYWGRHRLTGLNRIFYDVLTRFRNRHWFRGHVEDDEFFWGDVCKQRLKYVRNFAFSEINTLKVCPFMPYHDPARPFVNYWFASAEGASVESFTATISEENQDQLEAEGGACILSTHFAYWFYTDGQLNPRFKGLMQRLSRKNGWFVPVSTLLDHLLEKHGPHTLTDSERAALERRWMLHKLRVGPT
jgi:hypothetical protein